MPGKRGMVYSKPRRGAVRCKIWQSMRILRRFTIPDLCRTACARESNVKKFLKNMTTHGYVTRHGSYVSGRKGSYQAFRLVRDIGPDYPLICDKCGCKTNEPCEKQETT